MIALFAEKHELTAQSSIDQWKRKKVINPSRCRRGKTSILEHRKNIISSLHEILQQQGCCRDSESTTAGLQVGEATWEAGGRTTQSIRLSAFMILYFYPLYILIIKILFSILIFFALIHPLYHHLSTVGLTYHFI
jgi:hypothetical protein